MDSIHPKVIGSTIGSGVGAALATVFVWLLSLKGVIVPPDVTGAIGILFSAVGTLIVGYLTPSSPATKGP